MQISATYVTPSDFHNHDWWILARPGPVWYYHTPRGSAGAFGKTVWMDTVDEQIRPIVQWAHSLKMRTSPSCAGHSINLSSAAALFSQLELDAELIRRGGVCAVNVETGEKINVLDTEYQIPWTDYKDFLSELKDHQLEGYISINGNKNLLSHAYNCLQHYMIAHSDHVNIIHRGHALEFWVKAETSTQQALHWQNLWRILDDTRTYQSSKASASAQ